jgi:plastocyanin
MRRLAVWPQVLQARSGRCGVCLPPSAARPSPDTRHPTPFPRRRLLQRMAKGVLAAVVAPLLASCTGAIEKRHTVDMYDERNFDVQQGGSNGFTPGILRIATGDTVVWFNRGTYPHTATADASKARNTSDVSLPAGVAGWDSGDVYPGGSWQRRFGAPGKYIYFDQYQEGLGMIGTILVGG